MPTATATATPSPAAGALSAALQRSRRRLPRTLLFMVALSTGIGLLLSAIDHRGSNLASNIATRQVYAYAVGFACWGFTEAGRWLQAAAVDALRRRRGLPPSPSGFDSGWRGVLPATLLAMLAGPSLGLAVGDLITGHETPSLLRLDTANTRITLALTVLGSLVSIFVLGTMERLSGARAQAEAAQRQAAEHQLRLLQSQLEPHMLFNTLANLRVLIGLDAERAQAMLDHLIHFLRSTLEASRVDRHPLAAEFERTADYLALMAVRMGPRLQVQLDLPEALRAVPVPPLLLQPLVENAIQHGLEPKVDGGRIAVAARRDGDTLLLQVLDSGLGLGAVPSSGTGFGTQQVQERLATLYGPRAAMTLEPAAGGGTCASVRLPLD